MTFYDLSKANVEYEHVPLFSSISFNKNNSGYLEFRSNAQLSPYLASLGTQYTRYDFKTILEFKSIYSTLMYKLIKADLVGGHNQLLETEKVKQELSRFVQSEWRDIALGRTLRFDRGMIIPSKELKNGEICVPWMDDGE